MWILPTFCAANIRPVWDAFCRVWHIVNFPCLQLAILKANGRVGHYGSCDWEYPPEFAEDQHGDFFGVQWGSTTARGIFNAGSGGGICISEAIAAAESVPGVRKSIVWLD